jgi:integrase
MAKSFEFTDKYLAGKDCKPKEKQFYVREKHGFAIRVLPSGVITFLHIYTFNGKRYQKKLGNYPKTSLSDARVAYRTSANLVADGLNPKEHPEPEEVTDVMTVKGLTSLYIEHINKHLVSRSAMQQARTLEHDVLPDWGNLPAAEIRRKDAIALIEKIAQRAPGQARNVIKTARAMFTFALDREHVNINPFLRVSRAVPSTSPRKGERVLSDKEIQIAWHNLKGSEIGRVILLVLVTAQRPGEVAAMEWEEIDGSWWTIPWRKIKTEIKPHLGRDPQDHRVYLTPLALSLLPTKIDAYVFPANGRGRGKGAIGGMRPATMSHLITDHKYLGLPRWTPKDLRRTARTVMSRLGVQERHAEAVLNHIQAGVLGVYDKYRYDREKRAALTKWSKHLETKIL